MEDPNHIHYNCFNYLIKASHLSLFKLWFITTLTLMGIPMQCQCLSPSLSNSTTLQCQCLSPSLSNSTTLSVSLALSLSLRVPHCSVSVSRPLSLSNSATLQCLCLSPSLSLQQCHTAVSVSLALSLSNHTAVSVSLALSLSPTVPHCSVSVSRPLSL